MSEQQGRRIENSEERRGRPWAWILAGIALLLLLLFLIPFACQALTGSGGDDAGSGAGGGQQEETNGAQGEGAGGAGDTGEATTGSAPSGTTDASGEDTAPAGATAGDGEDAINADLASFGEVEGDGTSVTVPEASVTGTDGWLVIRDAGGEEGTVLGHAPLPEGTSSDVTVELDDPVGPGELYAMVHADDPADDDFTYPDGDPPIRSTEGVAVEPFEYAVTGDEAASETPSGEDREQTVALAEGEALPESGGGSPAPVLFGALAALVGGGLLAWMRLRESARARG